MAVNNPEPAYFWDNTTNSWRKAVVGEAGEYVWNTTTDAWQKGTIGAEYVWNTTTNSWDKGTLGGQYKWNSTTNSWDKNTSLGGGQTYWDNSTNSWVKNTGVDASAAALIARMTSTPSAARQTLITALVAALKTAGVWTKLDVLYVLAAHDAQAARLNWKADAYNLTAVNSPIFTTDRGYAGDGVSMHLTAGVNWNALTNYTQNDNCIFSWETGNLALSRYSIGSVGILARNRLCARTGAGTIAEIRTSSPSAFGPTLPAATSVGLTAGQRTGATAEEAFKNGVSMGTATGASGTPDAAGVALLRDNTTYAARSIAVAGIGGSLSSVQHAALYTALNTYLTAVGAA